MQLCLANGAETYFSGTRISAVDLTLARTARCDSCCWIADGLLPIVLLELLFSSGSSLSSQSRK